MSNFGTCFVRYIFCGVFLFNGLINAANYVRRVKEKVFGAPTETLTETKKSILEERAGHLKDYFEKMGQYDTSYTSSINYTINVIKDQSELSKLQPEKKEGTRFKILDLINQAADPKVFAIIYKDPEKKKALFDAIDAIEHFDEPEFLAEFVADVPEVGEKPQETMALSTTMFGQHKTTLSGVIESAFAELYKPMPEKLKERVDIISKWKDKNAAVTALQLLAAYDLYGASESKADDKFVNSMPIFNALWKLEAALPSKLEGKDEAVKYKVPAIGLFEPSELKKFSVDGKGDLLQGFCVGFEYTSPEIEVMCDFVKTLPVLQMQSLEEKKKEVKPVVGLGLPPSKQPKIELKPGTYGIVSVVPSSLAQSFSIPSDTATKMAARTQTEQPTSSVMPITIGMPTIQPMATPTIAAIPAPVVSAVVSKISTEPAKQPLSITPHPEKGKYTPKEYASAQGVGSGLVSSTPATTSPAPVAEEMKRKKLRDEVADIIKRDLSGELKSRSDQVLIQNILLKEHQWLESDEDQNLQNILIKLTSRDEVNDLLKKRSGAKETAQPSQPKTVSLPAPSSTSATTPISTSAPSSTATSLPSDLSLKIDELVQKDSNNRFNVGDLSQLRDILLDVNLPDKLNEQKIKQLLGIYKKHGLPEDYTRMLNVMPDNIKQSSTETSTVTPMTPQPSSTLTISSTPLPSTSPQPPTPTLPTSAPASTPSTPSPALTSAPTATPPNQQETNNEKIIEAGIDRKLKIINRLEDFARNPSITADARKTIEQLGDKEKIKSDSDIQSLTKNLTYDEQLRFKDYHRHSKRIDELIKNILSGPKPTSQVSTPKPTPAPAAQNFLSWVSNWWSNTYVGSTVNTMFRPVGNLLSGLWNRFTSLWR